METIQTNASPASTASAPYQPGMSYRLQHSKALVAIVAVLGVTVLALAGALVVKSSNAEPGAGLTAPVAAITAAPAPIAPLASVTPKNTTPNTVKHTSTAPVVAQSHAAAACANCGTVEAVTAVQREGKVNGVAVGNTTIGLGTVAGGVLGGLLGHQVGGGNGKNAATLLGAAGGAYAGNTIEKNMKKVTVYDVRVRMADGSHRNLDISTAPAIGSRVIVEGNNLRMQNATS